MPAIGPAPQPPPVSEPQHQLAELTTYELAAYRRDLERAIAFFGARTPVPAARASLQARLDEVTGEQAERAELAALREHDMTALTSRELECARRELAASLALARPGSPARVPILARLAAVDAELAARPPGPSPEQGW